MPLRGMRINSFRAVADGGIVTIGGVVPDVGRNDEGKA